MSTYEQIGWDINGKAGDYFGISVSLSGDGKTLVVGGRNSGDTCANIGLVRVYQYNQTINNYVQVGPDIEGDARFDLFGALVSLSADGTTFIAGSPYGDGNGIQSGHARVFRFNATVHEYIQIGPNINGAAADDQFGSSVDISQDGTMIAVGAIYNKGNGTTRSGHVRVFQLNTNGNGYVQVGSDITGGRENEDFGTSVSLSANGTTVVVGATNNGPGRVRVFQFNATTNHYVKVGSDIIGSDFNRTLPLPVFGAAVSVSANGTVFVASAPRNSDNGMESGQIRVFQWNPTTHSYEEIGSAVYGEAAGDQFGLSLSMSADGTTFITGSPFHNNNKGYVRIYKLDRIVGHYVPVETNIVGEADVDYFGASVSISADGTMFAAGAPWNDDGRIDSNVGHVRVYNETMRMTPTVVPTKNPTVPSPIVLPVNTPTNCGLFGFNWFCPRRGKCGLFRRLFRIHGC